MVPNDDKISEFQLALIIFLSPVAVGIFSLPAVLSRDVETNGWLMLIIGGLICTIVLYFICEVGKKYASFGFVGTLKHLFGKYLGTLLAIPVFAYYVITTAIEIRIFGDTTKMYLLFKTPLEFIMIPILILSVILARLGIEQIARFFEAAFPAVILTIVIITLIYLPKSHYDNLLPILKIEPLRILKGLHDGFFSFAGFEILFLLFPFIRKPEKAFKNSTIAIIFVTLFYIIIVIQCVARFGVDYVKTLLYPALSLIKASDIPGAFIGGIEGLLFSLWIVAVFTTIVMLIYSFATIGGDLLKHQEKKHISILLFPIVYIISLLPDNVVEVYELADKLILYLGYYSIIIIPTIMYIASLIKGRKKNEA